MSNRSTGIPIPTGNAPAIPSPAVNPISPVPPMPAPEQGASDVPPSSAVNVQRIRDAFPHASNWTPAGS